jgi:hypothetical protein
LPITPKYTLDNEVWKATIFRSYYLKWIRNLRLELAEATADHQKQDLRCLLI